MEYVAHINADKREQSVFEHCKSTARLASQFSIPELKQLNYTCGLLHDIGKSTTSFQRRIQGEDIFAPHAFYGAQEVQRLYGKESGLSLIAAYCIAGHHAGIPDAGTRCDTDDLPTLYSALARKGEEYSEAQEKPELDFKALEAFIKADCKTREDLSEKLAFA